jgi:inorganic pyrophosphatase/exopolyphosphatase
LDSIAGAIGAAELYGGYPARASEINSETRFAIDTWGVEQPMPIEDALQRYPLSGVCLVDHQQSSQLNKAISVERIVGVIDHHALQNSTIVTDIPIYIDIRPWGSMSTIITHSFLTHNRRPSKKTAGMLLCAILSDTLNLQGPTTTEWDRLMVTVLVEIAGVDDVQFLASQQFKAKSAELAGLSAAELVNGDQKVRIPALGCFPPPPRPRPSFSFPLHSLPRHNNPTCRSSPSRRRSLKAAWGLPSSRRLTTKGWIA